MLWDLQSGEHLQALRRDRPYEWLNIAGIKGLTEAQKGTLRALGAIEYDASGDLNVAKPSMLDERLTSASTMFTRQQQNMGETLIEPNAEARAGILRKIINSSPPADK